MTVRTTGAHDMMFRLAGVTLACSVALGGTVQLLDVRLGRRRWIHHALFGASLTANTLAATVDRSDRPRRAAVGAAVVALLALLPATRGGTPSHRAVGLLALGTHVVGAQLARSRYSIRHSSQLRGPRSGRPTPPRGVSVRGPGNTR